MRLFRQLVGGTKAGPFSRFLLCPTPFLRSLACLLVSLSPSTPSLDYLPLPPSSPLFFCVTVLSYPSPLLLFRLSLTFLSRFLLRLLPPLRRCPVAESHRRVERSVWWKVDFLREGAERRRSRYDAAGSPGDTESSGDITTIRSILTGLE